MNSYPIFKKELYSYFVSPLFYGVVTIFLILSGYFFYTDLTYYNWINITGRISLMQGLWQNYFNDLRFILMLLMPFVTMKLIAEEKKLKTFELITTYPVRDGEILVGKFLACLVIFLLMVFLTFTNVILLGIIWGFFEIEPLLAGYLGLFLLGGSLISCGIFISSLTENQFVAGIGTLSIFILFWFLTWNEMMASEEVINVLIRLSLFDRIEYFFKGVIDTKMVVFFILFSMFFLFLTLCSLESRKWKGKE